MVVSSAFASAASGNRAAPKANAGSGEADIRTLCSDLEAMGFYVRQCDTVKEATARIQELHVSKKFRCAIFDVCNYAKQTGRGQNRFGSKNSFGKPSFGGFNSKCVCLV